MDLNRELKTIVLTYKDEECVQLSGKEAEKFRDVIRRFASVYAMAILTADGHEIIDLNTIFNYELIRPRLKSSDIVDT